MEYHANGINVTLLFLIRTSVLGSDGRNQIAIRFNRYLNRNEYSIQTLRDSIQVPCDLMEFDSNFNDSIQETRDLNRNLEVMVEIEYSFSLLTAVTTQ